MSLLTRGGTRSARTGLGSHPSHTVKGILNHWIVFKNVWNGFNIIYCWMAVFFIFIIRNTTLRNICVFAHRADYYYLEWSHGSRISGSKTCECLSSRYMCMLPNCLSEILCWITYPHHYWCMRLSSFILNILFFLL